MSVQTEISIVGDRVALREIKTVRVVALDDWVAKIQESSELKTPVLPLGTRFYGQKDGAKLFIIEQRPAVRRISWSEMGSNTGVQQDAPKYELAFPFCVFGLRFSPANAFQTGWLCYAKGPILSDSTQLYAANLPNIFWPQMTICTAQMQVDADAAAPLAAKVEAFIGSFWNSQFNSDLLHLFLASSQVDERFRSKTAWQEASRTDPLFPLTVNWTKYMTVKKLIEEMGY